MHYDIFLLEAIRFVENSVRVGTELQKVLLHKLYYRTNAATRSRVLVNLEFPEAQYAKTDLPNFV